MPDLAIIVPVLNERENIRFIVTGLRSALKGLSWEVVFVDDDSPDGTADLCREYAAEDSRIRVIQRIGRTGLASACVEGMLATAAPWIAVMDGDLQHDQTLLPAMLRKAQQECLDIVIASRHVEGGSMGQFARSRVVLSNLGRELSSLVLRVPVTDPMSGYFLLSRSFLLEVVRNLSITGFKILVDILASAQRRYRVGEVPLTFRQREHGESKLDVSVTVDLLILIAHKLLRGIIPVRFLLYVGVGAAGVLVHLAVLALLWSAFPQARVVAGQIVATAAAILSNFVLNNAITFRDRKLKGLKALFQGLFWYALACSAGAVISVATTQFVTQSGLGWALAAGIGSLITALWNFGAACLLAWKIGERRRRFRNTGALARRSERPFQVETAC